MDDREFLLWVVDVVRRDRVDLFYNHRRWRKKRKDVLDAAKCDCAVCKAAGKYSEATVAHHIKPLRQAPMLAMSDDNLMAVCEKCHYRIHHSDADEKEWKDERW